MSVFTILSGSTRKNSQSLKVARYAAATLAAADPEATVELVDLAETQPQQWHEGFWEAGPSPCPVWAELSALLARSDGIVIVTPEWNGMAPPALMNLFLLADKGQLAHKPALLIGVSATQGGCYPVAELRAFSAKNTQICYIPDHVVVRAAREVLEGPEPRSEDDAYLRGRIAYGLDVLRVYARAFAFIRGSGVIDLESYPYGM